MHFAKSKAGLVAVAGLIAAQVSMPAQAQSITDYQTRREMALPTPTDSKALMALPAKKLFGRQKQAADLSARAIGSYARGCLAGHASVTQPYVGPS
jgi:penicillin-insensitive murein DD-endopeptidase